QHLVGNEPAALLGLDVDPTRCGSGSSPAMCALELQSADVVAQHQPYASVCVGCGDRLAQVFVEATQDISGTADDGDVTSECGEEAGKLHRDVTRAADDEASWEFLQVERSVGRDAELDAVERGELGPCAGGDEDHARPDTPAVRQ